MFHVKPLGNLPVTANACLSCWQAKSREKSPPKKINPYSTGGTQFFVVKKRQDNRQVTGAHLLRNASPIPTLASKPNQLEL
jgi:hypothetical protein